MFKENDYIVLLDTPITDTAFPPNYIFKQRSQSEHLSVKLDCNLNKNGWLSVEWDLSKSKYQWRYATIEEIEYYDLHNKPYNVTTLSEFKLPEKWYVKACPELKTLCDKHTANVMGNYTDAVYFNDTNPKFEYFWHRWSHFRSEELAINEGYSKITFNQFVKYVLNDKSREQDYSYLELILKEKNII